MNINTGERKNYIYTDYVVDKTTVRYVNFENKVFMLLFPNGTENKINDDY